MSGPQMGIADTLIGALAILREDAPAAYDAVAREIGSLAVRVEAAGENLTVASEGGIVTVAASGGRVPEAVVRTRRDVIVALLNGRLTLFQSVLERGLVVTGELDFLARLARAVSAFAAGALGSRRLRGLSIDFCRTGPPRPG